MSQGILKVNNLTFQQYVSQAVEPKAKMFGIHGENWKRLKETMFRAILGNQQLAEMVQRNEQTWMSAIDATLEGLECNMPAGMPDRFAYYVPRGNKICYERSYRGILQLIKEAIPGVQFDCGVVWDEEDCTLRVRSGRVEFDYVPRPHGDRNPEDFYLAFYTIVYPDSRPPRTFYRFKEDIMNTKAKTRGGTIWTNYPADAYIKTVIKWSFKYLDLKPEGRLVKLFNEMEEDGVVIDTTSSPIASIDGDIIETPAIKAAHVDTPEPRQAPTSHAFDLRAFIIKVGPDIERAEIIGAYVPIPDPFDDTRDGWVKYRIKAVEKVKSWIDTRASMVPDFPVGWKTESSFTGILNYAVDLKSQIEGIRKKEEKAKAKAEAKENPFDAVPGYNELANGPKPTAEPIPETPGSEPTIQEAMNNGDDIPF